MSTSWRSVVMVALIGSLIPWAQGTTIAELLARDPELSEFRTLIESKGSVYPNLLQEEQGGTVFVPTNDAINRWKRGGESRPLDKMIGYFFVNTVFDESNLPQSVATMQKGSPKFYLSRAPDSDWQFYVNEVLAFRRIKHKRHEEAYNIFILDDVPKLETTLPFPDASSLIRNDKPPLLSHVNTQFFNNRLTSNGAHALLQTNTPSTFFIPIGNEAQLNKYKDGTDKNVLRGHVIPDKVLFTPMFTNDSFRSEQWEESAQGGEGFRVLISLTNSTNDSGKGGPAFIQYATSKTLTSLRNPKGNVVAKIVKANVAVSNGVVHFIDKPLVVVADSVWDYIAHERNDRFKDFFNLLDQSPDFVSQLKQDRTKTLFIPTNEALKVVPTDVWDAYKLNKSELLKLLRYHLVEGEKLTQEMIHQQPLKRVERPTASDRIPIVMREIQCETGCRSTSVAQLMIECAGVNASVVSADIAATNGIVHVIDRVLGAPSHTLGWKLVHEPGLSTTQAVASKGRWNDVLDNVTSRFTFFAPSNEAWNNHQRESPSEHKHLVELPSQFHEQARRVMNRHLLQSELTLSDLAKTSRVFPINAGDPIHVKMVNGQVVLDWGGQTIRILRSDIHATNGMMHIIDKVMMLNSDMTSSSSSIGGLSIVISQTLLIVAIYIFRY